MPEFIVAVDHITYYAVQAEDEVTAIDLVLEGQGLDIASETRDASITEYEPESARVAVARARDVARGARAMRGHRVPRLFGSSPRCL